VSRIAIILNERSGTAGKQKALQNAIADIIGGITIYNVEHKKPIIHIVERAWFEGHQTIVAAGGDGTVSAVVNAILKLNIPAKFGVLPVGTLNHFARDIGIPKNIAEALDVVTQGRTTRIDVAKMNKHYFINNSSLGIYPFLVKERETIRKIGLGKWPGLIIALFTTFKRHPFVTVEFHKNGKKFVRKTPFVFIGNNSYNIRAGTLLGSRASLSDGKLSVFIAHAVGRLGLIRLAWHALRGRLNEQKDFDSIGLAKIELRSRQRKLRVSCDGEIINIKPPLHYSVLHNALNVIIP
jgi:YegS/Rv2252/BmrU family lipid kinase